MAKRGAVPQEIRYLRDPLTGEQHGGIARLQRTGGVVMRVRDWNATRRELPPMPIPTKIHTSHPQQATIGRLGGMDFSRETWRYLKGTIIPAKSEHASYAERHWWTPAWAEAELRANWPADVVDIVLAVRRDHQAWDDAMIGCARALADVIGMMRQMEAHCKRRIQASPNAA